MHSDDVRARIEVEPMPRCAFCNPETCGCPDYRVTVNGDSWNSGDLEYCALFAEKVRAFADAAHADLAGEVRELVEADREYDTARSRYSAAFRDGPNGDLNEQRLAQKHLNDAKARRSAALAKFPQEKL